MNIKQLFRRGKQPGSITVKELVSAYTKFAKTYYVKNGKVTAEVYCIGSSMRRLVMLYGDEHCNDFGPLALQAVVQQMIKENLARGTINDHIHRIKRMFKWAVSQELVPPSVSQALQSVGGLRAGRTAARETEKVRPVSEATLDSTLPHLWQPIRAMVEFQLYTGCRPEEVCMVRPCDIDRSDEVWFYRPPHHKMEHRGRERIIPIGPKAQDVLRPFLLRPEDSYCFSPRDAFRQRGGSRPLREHYTTDTYRNAIIRTCLRLRVRTWTPNQLRHLAATKIRKQFGLEAAQVVLGHSEADVTQIYAEKNIELAARVAAAVG